MQSCGTEGRAQTGISPNLPLYAKRDFYGLGYTCGQLRLAAPTDSEVLTAHSSWLGRIPSYQNQDKYQDTYLQNIILSLSFLIPKGKNIKSGSLDIQIGGNQAYV